MHTLKLIAMEAAPPSLFLLQGYQCHCKPKQACSTWKSGEAFAWDLWWCQRFFIPLSSRRICDFYYIILCLLTVVFICKRTLLSLAVALTEISSKMTRQSCVVQAVAFTHHFQEALLGTPCCPLPVLSDTLSVLVHVHPTRQHVIFRTCAVGQEPFSRGTYASLQSIAIDVDNTSCALLLPAQEVQMAGCHLMCAFI